MAYFDKYGVEFSDDRKTLVKCPLGFQGKYVIPNGVEVIGEAAFLSHFHLDEITFPDSLIEIEDYAFQGCSGLKLAIFPDSIVSIGEDAFRECDGLDYIAIPKSVTYIGARAFSSCSNVRWIAVNRDNPKYDSRKDCNAIIETETNTLVAGCKNTIIPNSVTSIGESAFSFCKGMSQIVIPDSVISIEKEAFDYCTDLNSVSLGSRVSKIGESAFSNCDALTSINFPDSLTTIGNEAFLGARLKNIHIPCNVKEISPDAFACDDMESIIVDGENSTYDSRDNCNAIIETKSNILESGCTNTIIPNSVTRIEWKAFECSNLKEIVIPESVVEIANWAFMACSKLESITVLSRVPPKIDCETFGLVDKSNCKLYVPEKAIKRYKSADWWKDFHNVVKIFEWTKKDEEILLRMFKNSFSYSAIAKALGCRKQEVQNHLEQLGYLSYNPTTKKYKKIK